jgi:hypothetical protein
MSTSPGDPSGKGKKRTSPGDLSGNDEKRKKIENIPSIQMQINDLHLHPLVDIDEKKIEKKSSPEKMYKHETDIREQVLYSIDEGDRSYLILISLHIDNTADAILLCIKEGDQIIFQYNGRRTKTVCIKFIPKSHMIEIAVVNIVGIRGICTRSVAYTMKALLHYINKKNMFAPTGKVHILSHNADRAFNCYNRAFLLNGYNYNFLEFIAFKGAFRGQKEYNIMTGENGKVDFTFEKYTNKIQGNSLDLDALSQSAPPKLKL